MRNPSPEQHGRSHGCRTGAPLPHVVSPRSGVGGRRGASRPPAADAAPVSRRVCRRRKSPCGAAGRLSFSAQYSGAQILSPMRPGPVRVLSHSAPPDGLCGRGLTYSAPGAPPPRKLRLYVPVQPHSEFPPQPLPRPHPSLPIRFRPSEPDSSQKKASSLRPASVSAVRFETLRFRHLPLPRTYLLKRGSRHAPFRRLHAPRREPASRRSARSSSSRTCA